MTFQPRELGRIQQWMQAVITHPAGVRAGIDSDAARSEIDIVAGDIEQVVSRSQALTSVERLEVYGNSYFARLLECLTAEFPAVIHAVGEEVFGGFAFGYLQAYPSTSYTLADLGRQFPHYLEEIRPDREDNEPPDWADFVIDLAKLERTYSEVFDAPGVEGEPLLSPDDLQAIPPEQWPFTKLQPVPCLRLATFRFPVHEYATAVRHETDAAPPAAKPTYLVITRRDFIVRRKTVTSTQFELLTRLVSGATVGDAIETVAATIDGSVDRFAEELRDWFGNWATAGYFHRVELPGEATPR
jgi:hypothetical protein